jgi:hypothetical protein
MFREKSFSQEIDGRNFVLPILLSSIAIWIVGLLIHLALATDFFSEGILRVENKLTLFSFLSFTYALFYYTGELIERFGGKRI